MTVTAEEYRSHYWETDAGQWRFALLMVGLPMLAVVWFDYRLYGPSGTFEAFAAMHMVIALYSFGLYVALGRPLSRSVQTALMTGWPTLGTITFGLNAYFSPPQLFGHYAYEIFILMLFYSSMPLPRLPQLGVSAFYLATALPILFFHKQPPSPATVPGMATVLLVTVIGGNLIARRIHAYRVEALIARLKLEEQARTDALTGIANRRAFIDAARLALARARREQTSLFVLMLDIDHFKKINDRYGHEVGDILLSAFARRIEGGLRGYDLFARLGGEEFAVLLPDCDAISAHEIAERLRTAIAATPFVAVGKEVAMTVSIGATNVTVSDALIDSALSRADAALYVAKHNGRDRVELATVAVPG